MLKLGYYLKVERQKRCLLQCEAARVIGVSRVQYSNMENDRVHSYAPATLEKVAEFLGKETEWVIKYIPAKNKAK